MNEENYMLTTFDNPFDPFEDFDRWWKQDMLLNHDCCGLLASTACVSDELGDEVNEKAIKEAMEKIVSDEPLIYKIVYKEPINA